MSLRLIPSMALILVFALIGSHGKVSAEDYRSVISVHQEIDTLRAEMEPLPELVLNPTPWTLGYRSPYNHPKNRKLQIGLEFVTPATIDLIALLPTSYTSNAGEVAAFGFPVRFTIERIGADGSSAVIVDYSKKDYVLTGIEPQLFHLEKPVLAEGIRLTILRQADNPTCWDIKHRREQASCM